MEVKIHKFLKSYCKLKIGFMLDIVDTADEVGQASFLFVIPVDAAPDVYSVDVQASADGYENASASTTFDVIGSGDFFDNSTSDNFSDGTSSSDGSSSSDNCCSSSNNDDFTSPGVKSTEPSDGDNNVPSDLSQITVTFSEKIDKNSVDSGSLSVFADNCGNNFCNDPDIQDVSVSSKSATFSINSNDRLCLILTTLRQYNQAFKIKMILHRVI